MIALIGAHGTGKTTLLQKLKERKPELVITDGDSRTVRAYNSKIGKLLSPRLQQLLINSLSDSRFPIDVQLHQLCCTRTPLDHYAYSKSLGWDDLAEERLKLFESVDRSRIKFFYLPIEFPLKDDGVRYMSKEYQKEIDSILTSLIERYKLDVVTLTGNVDERVETLLNHI